MTTPGAGVTTEMTNLTGDPRVNPLEWFEDDPRFEDGEHGDVLNLPGCLVTLTAFLAWAVLLSAVLALRILG